MAEKLILPALDGQVLLEGDSVSVMNGDELIIQVSFDEWVSLREQLRFDDTIDYARGETPMTAYQLRSCVELIRENKRLETEIQRLKSV